MTTYSTSTILAYQNAFLSAVQAVLPQGAVITDGPPPTAYLQTGTVVWIGNTTGSQDFRALGSPRRPKEEEYTMDVHISIYGPTTAAATNTHTLQAASAFAILADIESLLRSNPTLGLDAIAPSGAAGGYIVYSAVRGPINLSKSGNDTARETSIEFGVYVKAHL